MRFLAESGAGLATGFIFRYLIPAVKQKGLDLKILSSLPKIVRVEEDMRKQAVFEGDGGVAVVLWVLREEGDYLYVTDSVGLTETESDGGTRRVLAMSRRRAYLHDPDKVSHGKQPKWDDLLAF